MKPRIASINGIYGIPEVARYLGSTPPLTNGYTVATSRLRYWIRTSVSTVKPIDFSDRRLFIGFRDLISIRLIAVLRFWGVGIDGIRETETWMRQNFNVEWPFIWRPLWTYGSDAYTQFGDKLIVASKSGQLAMDFVNEWLSTVKLDMTFDENGLAQSWSPSSGVRIDPAIQLGDPCVDGTRIPTKVIWGKVKAGDTIEIASSLYGLDRSQVEQALDWEERLLATKS